MPRSRRRKEGKRRGRRRRKRPPVARTTKREEEREEEEELRTNEHERESLLIMNLANKRRRQAKIERRAVTIVMGEKANAGNSRSRNSAVGDLEGREGSGMRVGDVITVVDSVVGWDLVCISSVVWLL